MDLPNSVDLLLLALLLCLSHKQMPVFCFAAFHGHELVKLEYPPLAAAVALATFVEDRHARMVHALLTLAAAALVCLPASLPPTGHALLQRSVRVIVLRLGRWSRCACSRGGLGSRQTGSGRGQ